MNYLKKNKHMVYKKLFTQTISVICAILLLQSCNKNQEEDLFEKPVNSVKSIETRYYKPLFINDKWITGGEVDDILRTYPKIEYFDKFNNILLEKELRDTIIRRYNNFYTRTFYFDPTTGKKSKQTKLRVGSNMNNYGTREYKRDSLGRLTSIIETGHNVPWCDSYCPESISYDSEGNKTEKQRELTTITKKIHSDSDITVYMKQVINENERDSYYHEIYGLSEYEIITTDTETGNIISVLTEDIGYGTLSHKSMTRYKYNNNGNIIEEEIFKIGTPLLLSVPDGLSSEEEEKYIKKNYFGENVKYTSYVEKYIREYNSNNDLIYESYTKKPNISTEEFPIEFNIRSYSHQIKQKPSLLGGESSKKTYYEYVYNDRNDWTKRTKYHRVQDMSPFYQSLNKDKPDQQVDEIIIRKIEYFD